MSASLGIIEILPNVKKIVGILTQKTHAVDPFVTIPTEMTFLLQTPTSTGCKSVHRSIGA